MMSPPFNYNPNAPSGQKLFVSGETLGDVRYLVNPFEAMPFACRAWSKAAGAELNTQGAISSVVNLSSATYNLPGQIPDDGFGDQHSGEFNYPIQNLKPFYTELLQQLDILQNP